jgi:hypothetical protein
MKRLLYSLFIFSFSLLCTPSVFGQKCSDYDCVIRKVKKAMSDKNYRLAFEQLESAEGYTNKNATEVVKLRKDLFNAVEKEKEEAKKQKERADNNTEEAKKQTILAKKIARQSKSKELATKAILESTKKYVKDETIALRLAYTALEIDSSKEVRNIFDMIFENGRSEYYKTKVKGKIYRVNQDSTRFWAYDGDSTRIMDWTGKIYSSVKGKINYPDSNSSTISEDSFFYPPPPIEEKPYIIKQFIGDSFIFLLHYYDSWTNTTRIINGGSQISYFSEGEVNRFSQDSFRFIYYEDDKGVLHQMRRLISTDIIANYNFKSFIYQPHYKEEHTLFKNSNKQPVCAYIGKPLIFKADGKHVVMLKSFSGRYLLETRRLYDNFHDFMQNEVADFTPDERLEYGIDDYPKLTAEELRLIDKVKNKNK